MKGMIFASGIFLLLISGCTSTRITQSWKADNVLAKKYNKILVLGLNNEKDLAIRGKMETHLVGDLKNLGYNAVSALKEFGPKAFQQLTEKETISTLQQHGIDAVITIVLLDKTNERNYVPGQIYYTPYVNYYRNSWGYYSTMYERVYEPDYYDTTTWYFWESNLYDAATKELLYTVQTESFDPVSSEKLAHEYGKMIVKDMARSHILNKQETIARKEP